LTSRHVLLDTPGVMLHAVVHTASLQDRDGGGLVMATLCGLHPFLRLASIRLVLRKLCNR